MCALSVPCVCVSITVAEVVHVDAVLLQAAGALLDSRQEASPVAPLFSFPVQPPRKRTAICNQTTVSTPLQRTHTAQQTNVKPLALKNNMKPKDSFFLLIYNNTIEKKYEIRQAIIIIVYFKCCDVINSETTPHYLKPKTQLKG